MGRTKRPSLRQLADQQNVSVATLIDTAVQKHGTVKAAAEALGVDPQTTYQWISRNRYTVRRVSRLVRQ